jgi:bifunctional DNA-binding transcriptional regulator/antitoxin component of YhaV-PrlF toxin-antitoxin module
MPLTHSVSFKAAIGKGNRIQIPTLIRWEFKLEPTQLLTISIRHFNRGIEETFYTKMNKDGRITIPKINAELIKTQLHKEATLSDYAFEITLRPA